MDWSPDDRQLAIISIVAGEPSLTIAEADGSGSTKLPLDRQVNTARYLPDGRLAFIGPQEPGTNCGGPDASDEPCALLVVNADGTGREVILPGTSFMGLGLSPAPEGGSLIYPRWGAGEHGTVHLVDIASGQDRVLPVDGMAAWCHRIQQVGPVARREPNPVRSLRGGRRSLGRGSRRGRPAGQHRPGMARPPRRRIHRGVLVARRCVGHRVLPDSLRGR